MRWLRVPLLFLFVAPLLASPGDPAAPLVAGIALLLAPVLFGGMFLRLLDRLLPQAQMSGRGTGMSLAQVFPLLALALLTLGSATFASVSDPTSVARAAGRSAITQLTDPPTLDTPIMPLAWGWNNSGQLGDGGLATQRSGPNPIASLTGVRAVAAGGYHSLALLDDGTVWSWGRNNSGQLGNGGTSDRNLPVQVQNLSGIAAIAAGDSHSLALANDGTVWVWGRNNGGQLGDGSTTNRNVPVQVSGLTGVIALAAGGTHSLALLGDGTVVGWGNNGSGQLGDGTFVNRLTPIAVPDLAGVRAIAANISHTLALKADGTVWGWGSNFNNRLGIGAAYQFRTVPTQLPDLSGVSAIAAGGNHGLAVKSDGTVWAWGANSSGSIGDGTRDDRPTPVPVSGLGGIANVAAGLWQSFALTSDGAVWTWGYNEFGTLGRGTVEVDRDVPGRLPGLHGVQALSTWNSHTLALGRLLPYDALHNCALSTPWAAHEGQGVCATFGTFLHQQADLAVSGRGAGLSLARTYHSADPTDSGFGPGWSFTYGMSVHAEADGSLLVRMDDGRRDRYTRNADGTYSPPPGVYHTLTRAFSGIATLRTHDQFVYLFDNQGRLTSIADRNNNTTTLDYAATTLTITEPAGRQLALTYGSGLDYGHIVRAEEVGILGRVVQYNYDPANGNLTSVIDPRSHLITLAYEQHRLKTVTNQQNERVVDNLYDALTAKVLTQRDAKDNATTFDYSQPGRTLVDGPRLDVADSTTYEYDVFFRVMKVIDALGGTTEFVRDANHNPICVIDRFGGRTRSEFDSRGNVTRTVDARYTDGSCDGATAVTAQYNARNDPFEIRNARGFPTFLDYDGAGNLLKIRRPLGRNTTYEYDPSGNGDLIAVLDADNFRTSYAYDQWGHMRQVSGPGYPSGVTSFQYDAGDRLLGTIGAVGQVTDTGYNPVTASHPIVTARVYPHAGETLTTRTAFDLVGRTDNVTDPRGAVTNYFYEPNGNLDRVVIAANKADPERATMRYQYDPANNLKQEKDSDDRSTTYTYDALGRLLTTNPPGGIGQTILVYLDSTRQVQRTVPNLGTSIATYDEIGQLRRIDYPAHGGDAPFSITYDYDENGNRKHMVDQWGTTSYDYDELDRLLVVSSPLVLRTETRQVQVRYEYDIANPALAGAKNCLRVYYPRIPNDPKERFATSCLDTAGRLASVLDWRGNVTSYGYDGAGRLQSVTNPNQTSSSYGFDDADRLTSVAHYRMTSGGQGGASVAVSNAATIRAGTLSGTPGTPVRAATVRPGRPVATPSIVPTIASPPEDPIWDDEFPAVSTTVLSALAVESISTHTYTLDGAGNRTAITEVTAGGGGVGNGTTSLNYDAQQRLNVVTYPIGDPTPNESYEYTAAGQRKKATIGGVPGDYLYDTAGRLETDNENRTYDYYPNGNLKQRVGVTTEGYDYDAAGRLVKVQATGAKVFTDFARYDGDGQRLFSDMGVQNVGSTWDVNRAQPVVLYEDTPQGYIFYIHGLSLIARVLINGQGQEATLFYHADGVGSVRALTNVAGQIVAAYDYTAFGEVRRECLREGGQLQCNGTATNPARTNTWKFAGQRADAQTGLGHHGARYYDPSIGRFTQPDPAGSAGGNGGAGYAYAANNPATYGDATGLWVDTVLDVASIVFDLHQLATGSKADFATNLAMLGLDLIGAALPGITGLGTAYHAGRAGGRLARAKEYTVAFEMTLNAADIGKAEHVHETRAYAAFREARRADPTFGIKLERQFPDIYNPKRWVWHHHNDRVGVMQLVPAYQHTNGSPWWRLMHPDGVRGGYENWAIPAGAPPRPKR